MPIELRCVDCGVFRGIDKPSRAKHSRCKPCAQRTAKLLHWSKAARAECPLIVDDEHRNAVEAIRWHRSSAKKNRAVGRPPQLNGRRCYLHQFVWFLAHGVFPPTEIDHIDRDPMNNRIANLRLATRQLNDQNKSGVGVRLTTGTKPWEARLKRNNAQHVRRFADESQAIEWRKNAKEMVIEFECLLALDSLR